MNKKLFDKYSTLVQDIASYLGETAIMNSLWYYRENDENHPANRIEIIPIVDESTKTLEICAIERGASNLDELSEKTNSFRTNHDLIRELTLASIRMDVSFKEYEDQPSNYDYWDEEICTFCNAKLHFLDHKIPSDPDDLQQFLIRLAIGFDSIEGKGCLKFDIYDYFSNVLSFEVMSREQIIQTPENYLDNLGSKLPYVRKYNRLSKEFAKNPPVTEQVKGLIKLEDVLFSCGGNIKDISFVVDLSSKSSSEIDKLTGALDKTLGSKVSFKVFKNKKIKGNIDSRYQETFLSFFLGDRIDLTPIFPYRKASF